MQRVQKDLPPDAPPATGDGASADSANAQPSRRPSLMQHISFELALANGLGSIAIAGTLETVLALVRRR
jgi:hypothetical protein